MRRLLHSNAGETTTPRRRAEGPFVWSLIAFCMLPLLGCSSEPSSHPDEATTSAAETNADVELLEAFGLDEVVDVREIDQTYGDLEREEQAVAAEAKLEIEPPPADGWIDPSELPTTYYENQYRGQQLVSCSKYEVERSDLPGSQRLLTRVETLITPAPDRSGRLDRLRLLIVEENSGLLKSIDAEGEIDSASVFLKVVRAADRVQIQASSPLSPPANLVDVSNNLRGPLGVQHSLYAQPMRPGDRRALEIYDLGINAPLRTELTAAGEQTIIDEVGRIVAAVEVEQLHEFQNRQDSRVLWTNSRGEIVKQYHPVSRLTTFRVDRDSYELARWRCLFVAASDTQLAVGTEDIERLPVGLTLISKKGDPGSYVAATPRFEITAVNVFRADVRPVDAAEDTPEVDLPDKVAEAVEAARKLYDETAPPFRIRPLAAMRQTADLNNFEVALAAKALLDQSGETAELIVGWQLTVRDKESSLALRPHSWLRYRHGEDWVETDPTTVDGRPSRWTLPVSFLTGDERPLEATVVEMVDRWREVEIQALP